MHDHACASSKRDSAPHAGVGGSLGVTLGAALNMHDSIVMLGTSGYSTGIYSDISKYGYDQGGGVFLNAGSAGYIEGSTISNSTALHFGACANAVIGCHLEMRNTKCLNGYAVRMPPDSRFVSMSLAV